MLITDCLEVQRRWLGFNFDASAPQSKFLTRPMLEPTTGPYFMPHVTLWLDQLADLLFCLQ